MNFTKDDLEQAFGVGAMSTYDTISFEEWYNDNYAPQYGLFSKVIRLFCTDIPSKELYESYINHKDDVVLMQDFIGGCLKKEIHFATAISILDSVELIIEDAKSNGNMENI